jgi:hypothetical protein
MVNSPDAPAPEPAPEPHREIKTFVVRVYPSTGELSLIRSRPDEDDYVYLMELIAELDVAPQDRQQESFQAWFNRLVKPAVARYVDHYHVLHPMERLLWDQLEED